MGTGITKADHKAVYSKRGRTIGRWRPGGLSLDARTHGSGAT